MNERLASTRRSETYRGQHYSFSSPWKLNVGTDPNLDRLVPWGQPGYAYIPAELRKARGAPKYLRAEPVLMLGYQFMYTDVYTFMTAQLVFGCPSLSLTNEYNAIKSVVLGDS